jgi:hypothetical protein
VLAQLGIALALTVVIELAVVALLGGRTSRELVAVTAVNVVTNPVFNAALLLLRASVLSSLRPDIAASAEWAFIGVAEVLIVLAEWRLLVWALRADSRTWLVRSAAMNAVSLVAGSWLLAVMQQALAR